MKAIKNKKTGMLQLTRRKMIINDHSDEAEDKIATAKFGKNLKKSGDRVESLEQVSERQYKDTRPSINAKD